MIFLKTDEEYYNSIIKKKTEAAAKRKRETAVFVSLAVCAAAALTAAGIKLGGAPSAVKPSRGGETSLAGEGLQSETKAAGITEPGENRVPDMSNPFMGGEAGQNDEKSGGEIYGGGENPGAVDGGITAGKTDANPVQNFFIPAPAYTGKGFTDEELKEYIVKNAPSFASSLRADSIVGGGELKIFTTGYCHISIELNENLMPVSASVNRDFVTMPIMRGSEIIAEVTVYRAEGEICSSVSYGGDGFRALTKVFKDNPDSVLAFGYFGQVPEVIATSENKVYFRPSEVPHIENYRYYEMMETLYNTFSLSQLNDPDNYITV